MNIYSNYYCSVNFRNSAASLRDLSVIITTCMSNNWHCSRIRTPWERLNCCENNTAPKINCQSKTCEWTNQLWQFRDTPQETTEKIAETYFTAKWILVEVKVGITDLIGPKNLHSCNNSKNLPKLRQFLTPIVHLNNVIRELIMSLAVYLEIS